MKNDCIAVIAYREDGLSKLYPDSKGRNIRVLLENVSHYALDVLKARDNSFESKKERRRDTPYMKSIQRILNFDILE